MLVLLVVLERAGNCRTRQRRSISYGSISRVKYGAISVRPRKARCECAACLDASVAKGFVVLQRIQSGKAMLVRIVAMLTKLLERFDPEQFRVRESPSDPVVALR